MIENYSFDFLMKYLDKVEAGIETVQTKHGIATHQFWGYDDQPPLLTLFFRIPPGDSLMKGVKEYLEVGSDPKEVLDHVQYLESLGEFRIKEYIGVLLGVLYESYQNYDFMEAYRIKTETGNFFDYQWLLNDIKKYLTQEG